MSARQAHLNYQKNTRSIAMVKAEDPGISGVPGLEKDSENIPGPGVRMREEREWFHILRG